MTDIFRIGTRGSRLALAQASMVVSAIQEAHGALVPSLETKIIQTSGDWKPVHGETRLAESEGGKGLFAREIEQELVNGGVDCGVHSLKDLPAILPAGLVLSQVLERADPRDAFLCDRYHCLDDLPAGSVVGTASLRRQAFLLEKRPDLKIVPLRGNVPTRIEKMQAGQVDAIMLAVAGLKRLGLDGHIKQIFETDDFLPAGGQGVVGIETRAGDMRAHDVLSPINCVQTFLCVTAERAALQVLDASCRTPIGAYATLHGDDLRLQLKITSPDGVQSWVDSQVVSLVSDTAVRMASDFGARMGLSMKAVVPSSLLSC